MKSDTVVFRIESRAYLKKFREDNGWHINWNEVPTDVEVYALALHDSNEIQGLVGVKNNADAQAAYIHWACTAPQNNKHEFGKQKYFRFVEENPFAFGIALCRSWLRRS